MDSFHCWYGTNGSVILNRGYQAAKFTSMTSLEVIGSNSEKTSSQSFLSYVPKDLHTTVHSTQYSTAGKQSPSSLFTAQYRFTNQHLHAVGTAAAGSGTLVAQCCGAHCGFL